MRHLGFEWEKGTLIRFAVPLTEWDAGVGDGSLLSQGERKCRAEAVFETHEVAAMGFRFGLPE